MFRFFHPGLASLRAIASKWTTSASSAMMETSVSLQDTLRNVGGDGGTSSLMIGCVNSVSRRLGMWTKDSETGSTEMVTSSCGIEGCSMYGSSLSKLLR